MGDNDLSPIGQGIQPCQKGFSTAPEGISLDPEIFGIEGHPEGETGGEVFHFTAPAVNPSRIYLCTKKVKMITGIHIKSEMADMKFFCGDQLKILNRYTGNVVSVP